MYLYVVYYSNGLALNANSIGNFTKKKVRNR